VVVAEVLVTLLVLMVVLVVEVLGHLVRLVV
jgi:hypothetical protein